MLDLSLPYIFLALLQAGWLYCTLLRLLKPEPANVSPDILERHLYVARIVAHLQAH
jgi:hypothetical protein